MSDSPKMPSSDCNDRSALGVGYMIVEVRGQERETRKSDITVPQTSMRLHHVRVSPIDLGFDNYQGRLECPNCPVIVLDRRQYTDYVLIDRNMKSIRVIARTEHVPIYRCRGGISDQCDSHLILPSL